MKLLLLTLALVALVSAQCGTNTDLASCLGGDCGFCEFPNAVGLCMGCDSFPQCSDGAIAVPTGSGCNCAKTRTQCANTTIQEQGGASRRCAWCPSSETCNDPESDAHHCCVGKDDCKARTDRCDFCDIKDRCFTNVAYDAHCVNEACLVNCTSKPDQILCATNEEEFRNECELNFRRNCLGGTAQFDYEGRCCKNLEEQSCRDSNKCSWCNGKCEDDSYCEDLCATKDKTSCGTGCAWCDTLNVCLNSELHTCPVERPSCAQLSTVVKDRDFCLGNNCSYCDRTGKCAETIGADCRCDSLTTESACDDAESCEWCRAAQTCKSEYDFPYQQCIPAVFDKCRDIPEYVQDGNSRHVCTTTDTLEGQCNYCERLEMCYARTLNSNDLPKYCNCSTNVKDECEATDFCHWCNDKCFVERLLKPEDCGLVACADRGADACTGECAWCRTAKQCYNKVNLPPYCECAGINEQHFCNTIGGADAECNWCEGAANDKDRCVRGTQCGDGTIACNEKLGQADCAVCVGEGTWQFCADADNANGGFCTNQDSCNATEDRCPNFVIEPVVECVSIIDATKRIACLGYEADADYEFKVDSVHNIITGILNYPLKLLLRLFKQGRSRRFPGCAQRIEFTKGDRVKYCLCDRCVEIDETRICPNPKWILRFTLQAILSNDDLLAKIKLFLALKFPNVDIEKFIIHILTSKRQGDVEVSIEAADVDPLTVAAIDNTLNTDTTDLTNDVGGGATVTTQNTGSGVEQTSAQTGSSGASTLFVGLSMVLFLVAMLFTL